MWVNGNPLHFIIDSGSQKNLICCFQQHYDGHFGQQFLASKALLGSPSFQIACEKFVGTLTKVDTIFGETIVVLDLSPKMAHFPHSSSY
jgi:hypothetical protein